MSGPRRQLEPLRLEPRKPAGPSAATAIDPLAGPARPAQQGTAASSPGSPRTSPVGIVVIVVVGLLTLGGIGTGTFLLRAEGSDSSAPARPVVTAAPANDGTDPNRPVVPAADTGFTDARGGWGWSDKCWTNLRASKWGWAKAECDMGMAMNPAPPQPRASLLYNEGLIAKAAGKIDEARQDFTSSLAFRENAEVRAALNSLASTGESAKPVVDSRFMDRVQTPAGVVSIVQVPPMSAVVKLDTETVYPPTCPYGGSNCAKIKAVRDNDAFGSVRIINRVQSASANQAVLVMQEVMQGNACNGTAIWFTTFNADGSYVFSDAIDYCGGPDPTVYVAGSAIHVSVPTHAPNRGTGTIPGFDYGYDPSTGGLSRVR